MLKFFKFFRLLHYFDYNQNLFLYSTYIFIILILFVFVIYLYLVILSFNGRKIENKTILIEILRVLMSFISSILLIPLEGKKNYIKIIEIFLTVIVCDSKAYFSEKFACWSQTHIILLSFCSVCLLIMILLVYIFISLSFEKSEKFSSSVSKYLIINGSCIMMFCKSVTIILLEIYCVLDILNICIICFLISSLICSYSFFVERKYQNSKKNILIFTKYVLNIIYCWGCVLLFLGNLMKKKSFKGLLPIFLISSLLYIIIILCLQKDKFKNTMLDFKRDIDVYNNIRLFINSIEDKSKDRRSIMELISYSYNKTSIFQVKNIKNIENLSKIISNIKETVKDNPEIDFILYQHIDELYKNALNSFKNSPILSVNYAVFQMEKLHKFQKSYKTLIKATELHDLSFSEEFFIYRIKRNLEERGIEMGIEQTHISFAYQTKEILVLIQKIATHYIQFWSLLLNKNESMDINQLKSIGLKIDEMRKLIKEKYNNLVSNGLNTKKITTLYANFVKEVLNASKENENIKMNDLDNDEKFKESFFDLNYLMSKSDYQFIIINAYGDSFGIIKKVSLEICQLLGYSDIDLIGKNMNIIMPDFMREKHDKMLKIKIQNTNFQNYSINNLKEKFVLFRNSAKFLVPAYVELGIIFDENNHSMLFLKLTSKQDKNNDILKKKFFIMVNSRLNIQNFTPNCLNSLNFESNFLNGNLEIIQFIPEFNEEVLNILSDDLKDNEISPLNAKLIVLKEKYLNNSNIPILWKNNKKFECTITQFIILEEIIGFIFELDYLENCSESNLNNLNKRNSESNGKYVNRNSVFSYQTSNSYNNQNDSFRIESNFIPYSDDEINFNIEGKTFFLKNKNESTEDNQFLSIQKFFDKKYNDDIKLEKEIIEEEKSYISSSEESYEYDEEEEEEEIENHSNSFDILDNENNKNNSFFKQDNINYYQNYYKIHSNVKFSIYDYNSHSFIEIKKNEFESKVEEIINGEKSKTKRISFTKNDMNNKDSIKKYNLMGSPKKSLTLLNSKNLNENSIIKKLISPHFINKSIIFLSFFYFLSFILLIIVPYIAFDQLLNSIERIYKLCSHVHIQCSITENIILSCYYIFEFYLTKNPNYTLDFVNNRTEYSIFLYNKIKDLYNKSQSEIEIFIFKRPLLPKKSQAIIDNYFFNLSLYYNSGNYSFYYEDYAILIIPSIKIYFYFCFKNILQEEYYQNFISPSANFITSNYQKIADGMAVLNYYYLEEINEISNQKKVFLWIIFFIYFLSEIIVSYICVLGKIKTIREKEKFLNIFYKIDLEIINLMNSKCQKYSKIQIDNNSLTQKQDFLNSENSEDDEDSLLNHKESISSNKVFEKNKKKITNLSQENIFKNKVFKKELLLTIIFHLFLTIIILALIIITSNSYIIFYNSALINLLTLEQERNFLKNINLMRNQLKNSGYYLKQKKIERELDIIIDFIKGNFIEIREIQSYIYGNITKNGLPGNASSIIKNNLTANLCVFYDNFHNLSNITCEEIGFDIIEYGLMPIYGYYLKNILEIVHNYYEKFQSALKNNYIYFDYAYGSDLYSTIIPDYIDKEEYNSLNPFYIFNDKDFRDLNIIVINVLIPYYQILTNMLFDSYETFYKQCHDWTLYICIFFIVFVIIIYSTEILPMIIRENKDINKTRTILSVIPKNVIFEIIKSESLKESESGNN